MPPEEAGYTYAVEPAATNRLLANKEESIYDTRRYDKPAILSGHTAIILGAVSNQATRYL
jgi:hypothetical protein